VIALKLYQPIRTLRSGRSFFPPGRSGFTLVELSIAIAIRARGYRSALLF